MVLYMATALTTGFQVYWVLMMAIWGAPTSPLEFVSICGSVVLFIAGVLAKWRPRAAAMTALCASAAIWSFYAPSLFGTFIRVPYINLLVQPQHYLRWVFRSFLVGLIPAVLLVVTTYQAVAILRRKVSPAF